jgi:ADP-ribose pyrophosphatase YjhB (NUDIX family)
MPSSSPKTHLFCPICGTKYPNDQNKNYHKHCSHCNYTYFENQRTATGAIIIYQQKLLMVKRAIEPSKGMWDFPGGFVEPTEHPEQTIIREIKEELGIDGQIIKLFGIYAPNPYLYQDKINYVCDIFYLVKPMSTKFKPTDDVSSYQWFPIDKLPPKKAIAFPTTIKALSDLQAQHQQ